MRTRNPVRKVQDVRRLLAAAENVIGFDDNTLIAAARWRDAAAVRR